ncbi:MAG: hypothetical protein KDC56_12405, partial [Flavobacteriaceae bacterium]|nr:hypothetical protein [Flavobacteriaceae bacterium]
MKNTIISNRWNRYRIEQMRLITYMILLIIVIGVCISCDSFLEVDFPENQLSAKTVFQDDASALAALSAIYSKMRDNTLFNGESSGLSLSMGVYADELDYYGAPGQPFDNFYKHTIQPGNTAIATLWDGAYQMIYMANALLEGIADNDQPSPETI